MISYLEYKLLKEADAVPAGGPPVGAPTSGAPASGGDLSPPPGFSGGPPMSPDMGGGLGGMGGGPSFDFGGLGGSSSPNAANLKPSGLKSSNVWDVLEKIIQDK